MEPELHFLSKVILNHLRVHDSLGELRKVYPKNTKLANDLVDSQFDREPKSPESLNS
jgi:hypothetical protein